ncbi:MAG: DUF4230 domain-containing protein [Chthoniobacterales bacterium]
MKRIPRAVSVAIVLVALTFCAVWLLRSCAQLPGEAVRSAGEPAVELARRIADGVARRLQFRPEVRIDRETVLAGETPVLELVTVRREFAHEYEWEHQWLGSTKRLRLRGTFAAKAGFDLQEGFQLEVDSRDLRVEAKLPAPRVLGVEMIGYEAEEEEGLWNKLSAEERTEAVNALLASARASAERDRALTAEAQRMFEAQLGEIVAEGGGIFREQAVRD